MHPLPNINEKNWTQFYLNISCFQLLTFQIYFKCISAFSFTSVQVISLDVEWWAQFINNMTWCIFLKIYWNLTCYMGPSPTADSLIMALYICDDSTVYKKVTIIMKQWAKMLALLNIPKNTSIFTCTMEFKYNRSPDFNILLILIFKANSKNS